MRRFAPKSVGGRRSGRPQPVQEPEFG